ncbi:dynein axonemal assembly factor 10-like [Adelges cooleyi]|uniref:dynein axonemal assembly factor 10-like n=1 Tax=Adelges cooleyi TaxID=133065 RepID=UPI00217F2B75|nr:dynein axonemal assembly factor 10-like [Adelges cooleyi]
MDKLSKPQIIIHKEKAVDYQLKECQWIHNSAKFIAVGGKPNMKGVLNVYTLDEDDIRTVHEYEKQTSIECATFRASAFNKIHLAVGNYEGNLEILDLDYSGKSVYTAKAHQGLIYSVDGVGGLGIGCGAPELVTGGKDGSVKIWDPREKLPVAKMESANGDGKRDCWTVVFGNAYDSEERIVCAGYDNGDIKMLDLRAMAVRWETNVSSGVCCLEFDRSDIKMNKLAATTIESSFYVFDTKIQHPAKGFGYVRNNLHKHTIWTVRHLPQKREVFATTGGNGTVYLWKYLYPDERCNTEPDGDLITNPGRLQLIQNQIVTTQPINTFRWCPSKLGLALCTSFDQNIRILITTKLNLY